MGRKQVLSIVYLNKSYVANAKKLANLLKQGEHKRACELISDLEERLAPETFEALMAVLCEAEQLSDLKGV